MMSTQEANGLDVVDAPRVALPEEGVVRGPRGAHRLSLSVDDSTRRGGGGGMNMGTRLDAVDELATVVGTFVRSGRTSVVGDRIAEEHVDAGRSPPITSITAATSGRERSGAVLPGASSTPAAAASSGRGPSIGARLGAARPTASSAPPPPASWAKTPPRGAVWVEGGADAAPRGGT